MKLLIALLALILCLTGCAAPQSYETLSDTYEIPKTPEPMQVIMELPEDAGLPILQTDTGDRIYLCDDYWIAVQTFSAGDLDKTIRSITGYALAERMPIQTKLDGIDCYDCVWTVAGEGQTQTARLRLLDDGNYHYAVTVLADADEAASLQPGIQTLFRSIRLETPGFNLNTGS